MASVVKDGPALTAQGVALDLEGGQPLYFSHASDFAAGHIAKLQLKALRSRRASEEAAQKARMVENWQVCNIDINGLIRGANNLWRQQDNPAHSAQRLKNFHRRWQHRQSQQGGALWCTDRQGSVLWSSAAPACQKFDVDAMGVVQGVQNLSQPSSPSMSSANRLRVFHRKRQLRVQQQAAKDPWMPSVACVHPNGFVSWNLPSPKLSPCAAPLTPRKLPLRAPSCRIDPEGHVHDLAGMTPPMSPADSWRTSGRLKLFHRKRHQRLQPASAGAWKLSIDLDGEMHWTMGPEEIDFVRAHSGATTPSMDWNQLERKMSMDSEGVLQRKMSLDSEGVLNLSTLQSPGFRRQRSCSLDSEGIVHDLEAPVGNLYSPASGGVHDRASVDRLKLFHRKRVSRGQVQGHPTIIVEMDDSGHIQGWHEVDDEPMIVRLDEELCA